MIAPSSARRKSSPARMPHPSMSEQSSGAIQAKFGVVDACRRSAASECQRDQVRRAVGRPVADVGEVHHRHGRRPSSSRAPCCRTARRRSAGSPSSVSCAASTRSPMLRRVDRVLRVLLGRVVERDAERAAAGQGEVVAVARVLLGEEVGQQAGPRQQAVQVRRLRGVADDLAEVLVLEVEQEHVLVARHAGGGRGQHRAAGRYRHGEAQAAGDGAVVADHRRVRPVVVRERGAEVQLGLGGAVPAGIRPCAARNPKSGWLASPEPPTGPMTRSPSGRPAADRKTTSKRARLTTVPPSRPAIVNLAGEMYPSLPGMAAEYRVRRPGRPGRARGR